MIDQAKDAPAGEWIRAVEREGFVTRKTKGSHQVYQHSDGRRVLVVYHSLGDTLCPKAIRQLLDGKVWGW